MDTGSLTNDNSTRQNRRENLQPEVVITEMLLAHFNRGSCQRDCDQRPKIQKKIHSWLLSLSYHITVSNLGLWGDQSFQSCLLGWLNAVNILQRTTWDFCHRIYCSWLCSQGVFFRYLFVLFSSTLKDWEWLNRTKEDPPENVHDLIKERNQRDDSQQRKLKWKFTASGSNSLWKVIKYLALGFLVEWIISSLHNSSTSIWIKSLPPTAATGSCFKMNNISLIFISSSYWYMRPV